jgi:hypothetical protein
MFTFYIFSIFLFLFSLSFFFLREIFESSESKRVDFNTNDKVMIDESFKKFSNS